MGKWVVDYIQEVSLLLFEITAYREKNIRLHLKAHSDLLPFLFAFSHQYYVQYLTQHHVGLTNLSFTKPQVFSDLEIFGPGVSLSGNKFSTIPGDLVTEVAIYREVKVRGGPMRGGPMRGGPMRGGHSDSINAENFILNSHMLPKLKKELKNKMNLKTESYHKESTPRENKKHEEQIAELIGSLGDYVDPFHGATRNMATDVGLPSNITNGLL